MQQYTGLLFRIFFILEILAAVPLPAQDWSQAFSQGGPGDENCQVLAVTQNRRLISGGTFSDAFSPAGEPLPTYGGEDIFLSATLLDNLPAEWAISMGSNLDDQLDALVVAPNGDLLAAGSYWLEGFFGDTTIVTSLHPRAIFLARFDPSGQLRWVQNIEGTGLKQINELATDADGNLYLAGYFSEVLVVNTDTLKAAGNSDLFLLKLNGEGSLIWGLREGLTGDTRAVTLAVDAGREVVVGGYFNDTTRIAGELLTANTADRDVFLARYAEDGSAVWARKAGGVLDDDITRLVIDATGDIFVAGYLIGVMTLDENLSIQSSTGWSDFYLLHYSADGTPLAARAMGGTRLQEASDLVIAGGRFLVSGFYQGEMTIDDYTIVADEFAFSGFVAAFNEELRASWLKDIPGAPLAFATRMAASSNDEVWVGGTYQDSLQLGSSLLLAQGGFDVFLAQLASALTPVTGLPDVVPMVEIFPNPATDIIMIRSPLVTAFTVELFSITGQPCGYYDNPDQIPVAHLPSGTYLLRWRSGKQAGWQTLVIH